MQVIKFDEAQWRKWLAQPRSTDDIIQRLQADRFEIVQGWTEERVAALLFSDCEESYWRYGFGVTTHLPKDFLSSCLHYIENLDNLNDESISYVFTHVAWDSYKPEIIEFAQNSADELEESIDFTLSENIQAYIPEWLEYIVREAIESYTSPIAFLTSPSNYTE